MYRLDKVKKESKYMKILFKIINILVYIIFIPIILYNVILITKAVIYKNEIPDFFGFKNFVIVSRSMEDTIMKGDAIWVKEVPEDEINAGDIISFRKDGEIITHRIVREETDENGQKMYITKGDNNNIEDRGSISYQDIEGKYQFKLNGFGTFLEILESRTTLIILIFIMILNILYSRHIRQKKIIRRLKRENYNKQLK